MHEGDNETINNEPLDIQYYKPLVYINGNDQAFGFYEVEKDPDNTINRNAFTAQDLAIIGEPSTGEGVAFFYNGIGANDVTTISSAKIKIAPAYPVLIDYSINATGMNADPMAPVHLRQDNLEKIYTVYGKAAEKEVYMNDGSIVTGINDIVSKAVQSVHFVNVAGQMSDKPFEGVNIVVTKYTDGSTQAVKMVK